jgi:hypothetical protein
MSVVFALLVVVSLILADCVRKRRDTSGTGRDCSIPGPTSLHHQHKSTVARQTGALLAVLMVVSLLIAVGMVSRRVMSTHTSQSKTVRVQEGRVPLSDDAKRQLEADLADSSIRTDLTTMRAYQKALTNELDDTNERLKGTPGDKTLLKRKQVLEVLITNPGATGVNDTLAAIETSLRMVALRAVYTDEDEAAVRRAVANLRGSVASWKAGTLANAGRHLGLHWTEGRGLTTSAPYIWGKNGWEADLASQKVDKRGPRVKPTLEPAGGGMHRDRIVDYFIEAHLRTSVCHSH